MRYPETAETGPVTPVTPVARPSLREEQKRLTRNRVLDAAVTVFGEKSFVEATMEDIARAAGVTRVTVYAHFGGGKSEIIQALVARAHETVDASYADLAAMPRWTRAGIRGWLEALTARWRGLAPTIRVLTAAVPMVGGDSGSLRELHHDVRRRRVGVLAGDPARWRGTSAAEARQRVLMAALQLETFLTVWIAGDWPVDTADPLDLLTDTICHLLAPALSDEPRPPRPRHAETAATAEEGPERFPRRVQ